MSGTAVASPPPAPSAAGPSTRSGVAPLVGLDRVRLLVGTAMGTVLVSYGMLVAVAALVVLPTGALASVDELFAVSVPLWLAAHQVPLVLDGVPLTALPLLPTFGVLALVAASARFAARRLAGNSPAGADGTGATAWQDAAHR